MKLPILFSLFYLFTFLPSSAAQPKQYDSYTGLVMAGYQGWFNTPDDGAGRGWYHYRGRNGFQPGSCAIDMLPDVAEYEKTYPTAFRYADGEPVHVISSHDASTVETHFRWMREYGIDGAFMQRFVVEIKTESGRRHFDKVLASAMQAANRHQRAICLMYDLSGMKPGDEQALLADIDTVAARHALHHRRANPSYLYHNGKPLVSVWGVGFNDGRQYGLREAETIVKELKNKGFSIMLGVPTHWRTLDGDTERNPKLHELILRCDIVMPWFVGRYDAAAYDRRYHRLVKKDVAWARTKGVGYAPLAFPGFSWKNLKGNEGLQIPRSKGSFLWQQLSGAIGAGAEMLYIAMFDEVDEGTAIFKCAKRAPVGASEFLTIDPDLPTDHYLWLAGQAAKMLRGEIPLSKEMPKRE